MRHGWLDFRTVAIGATLFALIEVAAYAQTAPANKPERRPPTPPTSTQSIPSGLDTGTPAGSKTKQLGSPVVPANDAERSEIRNRSAAARAAARPRAGASASALGKDCAPGVAASGAPVALPGSGFVGGSASPATAAALPGSKAPGC